jgi:hypothetical protein
LLRNHAFESGEGRDGVDGSWRTSSVAVIVARRNWHFIKF